MGKILYSTSGEGRGHATRVKAIVDTLKMTNDVIIYAPGMAFDMLASAYNKTSVQVRPIPGLFFHYSPNKKLNYIKTGRSALSYLRYMPFNLDSLQLEVEHEQPDLIITDFEPLLPRVAQRCKIPFISMDHQHFLLTYDLSSLPLGLRLHASFMAQIVKTYYSGQNHSIVSSFYFPSLKRSKERNVSQIGVILRKKILRAAIIQGNHIVVYLRRFITRSILNALKSVGLEIHIYGLGKQPRNGLISFYDIDIDRFIEDLATSRALVSTAGNQLIGEALFLQKPVLAMPECGNFEQKINAFFLEHSHCGQACEMDRFNLKTLQDFLKYFNQQRPIINRFRLYGNPRALRIIGRYIPIQTHDVIEDTMRNQKELVA